MSSGGVSPFSSHLMISLVSVFQLAHHTDAKSTPGMLSLLTSSTEAFDEKATKAPKSALYAELVTVRIGIGANDARTIALSIPLDADQRFSQLRSFIDQSWPRAANARSLRVFVYSNTGVPTQINTSALLEHFVLEIVSHRTIEPSLQRPISAPSDIGVFALGLIGQFEATMHLVLDTPPRDPAPLHRMRAASFTRLHKVQSALTPRAGGGGSGGSGGSGGDTKSPPYPIAKPLSFSDTGSESAGSDSETGSGSSGKEALHAAAKAKADEKAAAEAKLQRSAAATVKYLTGGKKVAAARDGLICLLTGVHRSHPRARNLNLCHILASKPALRTTVCNVPIRGLHESVEALCTGEVRESYRRLNEHWAFFSREVEITGPSTIPNFVADKDIRNILTLSDWCNGLLDSGHMVLVRWCDLMRAREFPGPNRDFKRCRYRGEPHADAHPSHEFVINFDRTFPIEYAIRFRVTQLLFDLCYTRHSTAIRTAFPASVQHRIRAAITRVKRNRPIPATSSGSATGGSVQPQEESMSVLDLICDYAAPLLTRAFVQRLADRVRAKNFFVERFNPIIALFTTTARALMATKAGRYHAHAICCPRIRYQATSGYPLADFADNNIIRIHAEIIAPLLRHKFCHPKGGLDLEAQDFLRHAVYPLYEQLMGRMRFPRFPRSLMTIAEGLDIDLPLLCTFASELPYLLKSAEVEEEDDTTPITTTPTDAVSPVASASLSASGLPPRHRDRSNITGKHNSNARHHS